MQKLTQPTSKIGAEFLDEMGDTLRVMAASDGGAFILNPDSDLRFPNAEAPALALAILTAAGLIKPAGVVAEDETQGHRRQTIDGEYYSANDDPQFWVGSVDRTMVAFLNEAQYLVRSTAVRDYFADETARAAESAEKELTKRRDVLAQEFIPQIPGITYDKLATDGIKRAIDMIIQLQDEAKK